jgi:hypothetical protein
MAMISASPTQVIMPFARIRHGTASRSDRLVPVLLALAALFAGSLVMLEAPTPIRLPVVLAFLAMGPGLSIINLFSTDDVTQKLALSLGLSIGLDTIVAGLALYAGLWSSLGIMLVLVGITLAGAGAQLRYTPGALGFVAPAVPETAPDTLQAVAEEPATEEAIAPPATDVNDEAEMVPVFSYPPHPPKPSNVEVEGDVPPSRLARAMVLIGLIGGCIMIIARTSQFTGREK